MSYVFYRWKEEPYCEMIEHYKTIEEATGAAVSTWDQLNVSEKLEYLHDNACYFVAEEPTDNTIYEFDNIIYDAKYDNIFTV